MEGKNIAVPMSGPTLVGAVLAIATHQDINGVVRQAVPKPASQTMRATHNSKTSSKAKECGL
jgi:hypothetical protein